MAKQAAGWAAEKLSCLKTSRAVTGNDDLALLLSMEALSAGVEGKRCLWQALQAIAEVDPAFEGVDFDTLCKRPVDQSDRLEVARGPLLDGPRGHRHLILGRRPYARLACPRT